MGHSLCSLFFVSNAVNGAVGLILLENIVVVW
jgi:hypothetical protein